MLTAKEAAVLSQFSVDFVELGCGCPTDRTVTFRLAFYSMSADRAYVIINFFVISDFFQCFFV